MLGSKASNESDIYLMGNFIGICQNILLLIDSYRSGSYEAGFVVKLSVLASLVDSREVILLLFIDAIHSIIQISCLNIFV